MQRHEGIFQTREGTPLYRQAWLPDGNAQAALLIVHGFAEHSGRHAWHAGQLAECEYAVHALDLRGHGRSPGERVYADRIERYVDDLDCLAETVRSELPGRPLFVFGHSMGGLIAALWAMDRQPALAGIVLSAPALMVAADLFPWLRHVAGLVGRWLPRLRLVRLGSRNLSRDERVVAAFRADPLVFRGRIPVRTGAEILRAGPRAINGAGRLAAPLLVLQGTADRVVDPLGAEALVQRAGVGDKTLLRYEGLFHELLSEPERDQVLADLIAWLHSRRFR